MKDKLQNRVNSKNSDDGERGIALITSLLVTTMLLALGLAVTFSSTTDTVTGKSQRVGEMAFYAADTGLSISRRALMTALTEEVDDIRNGRAAYGQNGSGYYYIGSVPSGGGFPDIQVIPDPDAAGAQDYQFFKNIYAKAGKLIADAVKDSTFDTYRKINGSNFVANIRPLSGSVDPINTAAANPIQAIKFRYSIQVTGTTDAGGSSTVDETGRISIDVTLASSSEKGKGRDFSFSGFDAFFDDGDTMASSALASGTFSGPVHTNTHFAFLSNRAVAFRDTVSQVDSYVRYDSSDFNQGHINLPKQDMAGIDISSQGYNKVNNVPLPANNFSQEYAVINGTGILDKNSDGTPVDPPAVLPKDPLGNLLPIFDAAGRVAAATLAANLRDSSNNAPPVLLGKLNGGLDGVYVPSGDGTRITGAGIYVQGNVSDMQLYTNGTDQVYVIKQSSGKVTTITVSYANRNIYFGVRFSGGTFRPPYFPGTDYDLGKPAGPAQISIASVNDAKPVGVSWFRENN